MNVEENAEIYSNNSNQLPVWHAYVHGIRMYESVLWEDKREIDKAAPYLWVMGSAKRNWQEKESKNIAKIEVEQGMTITQFGALKQFSLTFMARGSLDRLSSARCNTTSSSREVLQPPNLRISYEVSTKERISFIGARIHARSSLEILIFRNYLEQSRGSKGLACRLKAKCKMQKINHTF